jgi:hypothetical protein
MHTRTKIFSKICCLLEMVVLGFLKSTGLRRACRGDPFRGPNHEKRSWFSMMRRALERWAESMLLASDARACSHAPNRKQGK